LVPVWKAVTGGVSAFGGAIGLQVMVEERLQHLLPELGGGVAGQLERAEAGAARSSPECRHGPITR
jgi:hypothetical protein